MKLNGRSEETVELFNGCGQELAEQLINSAVDTAKDKEQLTNQIYIAYRASVSMLSSILFNLIAQEQDGIEEFMKRLRNDILAEVDKLSKDDTVEFVTKD